MLLFNACKTCIKKENGPCRDRTDDLDVNSITLYLRSSQTKWFFISLFHLRDNHLLRLDVVTVEVTLEVEVRELLRLRHLEELAERDIRRDVVLVLQVLLLDVVVDLLRHVGAADERALGVAEEEAELIRHLRGDLEDARATRLGTLLTLGTDATLTLAGILDLAVDTLVETLDLRDHGTDRLTERREGRQYALEVLIERRGRGSRLRGRSNRDSRSGRSYN